MSRFDLGVLPLDGRALRTAEQMLDKGLAERRASFELTLSALPASWGFAVAAGMSPLVAGLGRPLMTTRAVAALHGAGLVSSALAERIEGLEWSLDVDGVPEGTHVFVGEPLVRAEGPLLELVLASTFLRSIVQRSTSVATRAARLSLAAGGQAIVDGSSALVASSDALVFGWAAAVGGAVATTSPYAAAAHELALRAPIDRLLRDEDDEPTSYGWGRSPADELIDLGDMLVAARAGRDEEGLVHELHRAGALAGGWIARALCSDELGFASARFDLVALEEDGVWAPRRGIAGHLAAVVPGRKRLVRYFGPDRRALFDWVFLDSERMTSPGELGAVSMTPLARSLVRGGRAMEGAEPAAQVRERVLASRKTLPDGVLRLRYPDAFRVEPSLALRELCAP